MSVDDGEYQVLNGIVKVGDHVAFAVRDGNTAEIRIGEVIGSETRKATYGDEEVIRLKVRVYRESGLTYRGARVHKGGRDVDSHVHGIENLDRVVKL